MKNNFFITVFILLAYSQIIAQNNVRQLADSTIIYEATYKFGNVKISLKQTENYKKHIYNAWVYIKKDGQIINKRKYLDIEALGGAYGLLVPSVQPSDKYFLILKQGDYDGRSLLIDKNGNLIDLPGGLYFITKDKRYLFVEHSEDCCDPFCVFDLKRGKVVFKDRVKEFDKSPYGDYEEIYYYQRDKDVYVIFNDDDNDKKIYKYDFIKNILVKDKMININETDIFDLYSRFEETEYVFPKRLSKNK